MRHLEDKEGNLRLTFKMDVRGIGCEDLKLIKLTQRSCLMIGCGINGLE